MLRRLAASLGGSPGVRGNSTQSRPAARAGGREARPRLLRGPEDGLPGGRGGSSWEGRAALVSRARAAHRRGRGPPYLVCRG